MYHQHHCLTMGWLDSLTGSGQAEDSTRLQCLSWQGSYGWMPFLTVNTLQIRLGAFLCGISIGEVSFATNFTAGCPPQCGPDVF